jgi:hypothetical protein
MLMSLPIQLPSTLLKLEKSSSSWELSWENLADRQITLSYTCTKSQLSSVVIPEQWKHLIRQHLIILLPTNSFPVPNTTCRCLKHMLFLQSKKSFLYQTTAVADQMFQMNSYKECRWTVLFYDSAAQMEIHRWFSMTLQDQAAASLLN